MSDKEMLDVTAEIAKEIAKDAYDDVGKPVMKPTGELVGLIPRAIKAALSPLEKWVLQKEYNVAETKKLLEEKLQNTPPELIESPEPHIAVPAMQYISYCMDNEELREMYANLLANSMNKAIKNGVHPGFVEIIKQLSPDEAKVLKYLSHNHTVPTITLRYNNDRGEGIEVLKNFSNVGEKSGCDRPMEVNKYFDNLIRLGLLRSSTLSSLSNKQLYEPLKEHPYMKLFANDQAIKSSGYQVIRFEEGFMRLTDFGQAFCQICLSPKTTITVKMSNN